jgi:hypothetical protein
MGMDRFEDREERKEEEIQKSKKGQKRKELGYLEEHLIPSIWVTSEELKKFGRHSTSNR